MKWITLINKRLNPKQKIYIIIIIVLLALFGYLLYLSLDHIFNMFRAMVGHNLFSITIINALFPITVGLVLYFVYEFASDADNKSSKLNKWIWVTFIMMAVLIFSGTSFIYFFVGVPNLDSVLWDSDKNKIVGELDCEDETGFFIVGSTVTCSMEPELHNYRARIDIILKNATVYTKLMNNTISFLAVENVKRIIFKIDGFDENDKIRHLEVGRPMEFQTIQQSIDRKDKVVAYLIGLFAVVLFSVPSMMVNLKNLYDDKKN